MTCTIYLCYTFYFALYPKLPNPGKPPVLYSNQCNVDLRLLAVSAMEQAKESIHLVMFGLKERSILQKLIKKSSEDLVDCHIYYDPSASPRFRKINSHFFPHPVPSRGLMHQKILVIDEAMVFLGSANMTKSSLEMHDNLVIGMVSPKIARFLTSRTPYKSGHIKTLVGSQWVELYLLPDPRGYAIQAIKDRIREAKKSLQVAMFTFTHPALVDAIIDAQTRGVKVTVAIDKNAWLGSSHAAIKRLEHAGIDVMVNTGSSLLHHKFLWVDGRHLILGSANWTKSAFYKNQDSFLILHNMSDEQKNLMRSLWRRLIRSDKAKSTRP